MSSHLGINGTFALLDRLKSAVQNFAAREEKLTGEFRVRFAAETKAFETAREEQASWLTEGLAGMEATFETKKDESRSKFESRKTRINQAHTTASKRVREGVGGFDQRIRENLTQAERDRDAELANAAVRISTRNWPKAAWLLNRWRKRSKMLFAVMANSAG